MGVRGHGVSKVGKEWDPGAGQVSQDSNRAGSEGVPGPGERTGGGGAQTNLHPVRKRRRLDDNDNVGSDKAVKTTNTNRKQPRAWVSGKRRHKQINKQTDGQFD